MSAATPILELKGLTKRFGGLAAVNNVSFQVREGGISGLIGPNGAGKTTIFNLITGVYKVTEGEILFQGKPIHNQEPYRIACGGVTRTFQNIRLFKNLSVFDNVYTACHLSAQYNLAALGVPPAAVPQGGAGPARQGHGPAADHGPGGPPGRLGQQPALRAAAPAGDHPGPGPGPQAAAPGRAGGRHEPRRDRTAHAPHRRGAQGSSSRSWSSSTTWT